MIFPVIVSPNLSPFPQSIQISHLPQLCEDDGETGAGPSGEIQPNGDATGVACIVQCTWSAGVLHQK